MRGVWNRKQIEQLRRTLIKRLFLVKSMPEVTESAEEAIDNIEKMSIAQLNEYFLTNFSYEERRRLQGSILSSLREREKKEAKK